MDCWWYFVSFQCAIKYGRIWIWFGIERRSWILTLVISWSIHGCDCVGVAVDWGEMIAIRKLTDWNCNSLLFSPLLFSFQKENKKKKCSVESSAHTHFMHTWAFNINHQFNPKWFWISWIEWNLACKNVCGDSFNIPSQSIDCRLSLYEFQGKQSSVEKNVICLVN